MSSISAAHSRSVGSPACASARCKGTSWSASEPDRVAGTPPVTPGDRLALVVATALGSGYSPVAPGTAGSVLTALVLWLVPFSRSGLIVFLSVIAVVGTWASHRAERMIGGKDPGAIVIDEVAGMTLSVVACPLPLTLPVLITGFLLFRILDIVKPFPAGASQGLPGGYGVMVDDLIAGLYTLGVLAALRAVVHWP